MGAINKETLKYEYPKIASKENKYKCPSCDKDVIFRKGKIKQSHYAHKKSDNPCYYYDRPSDSQIHKDSKMLMKMLLDNKTNMAFYRKCYNYCEDPDYIFEITPDTYNDSTTAIIEYKFQYNNSNRSADVALVENNNIKYIFEICYKNKTKEENRPEPWVEIDAETFINNINSNETNSEILIECKREHKCGVCEDNENYERKQYYNMLEKMRTKEKEQTNEKLELFNMGKEDERTIQIQNKIALEREKERLERENLRKQLELEKEQERKK
jgi:competence CoiA-like predicted nuclease